MTQSTVHTYRARTGDVNPQNIYESVIISSRYSPWLLAVFRIQILRDIAFYSFLSVRGCWHSGTQSALVRMTWFLEFLSQTIFILIAWSWMCQEELHPKLHCHTEPRWWKWNSGIAPHWPHITEVHCIRRSQVYGSKPLITREKTDCIL